VEPLSPNCVGSSEGSAEREREIETRGDGGAAGKWRDGRALQEESCVAAHKNENERRNENNGQ
jgi:hypothetical protein